MNLFRHQGKFMKVHFGLLTYSENTENNGLKLYIQ